MNLLQAWSVWTAASFVRVISSPQVASVHAKPFNVFARAIVPAAASPTDDRFRLTYSMKNLFSFNLLWSRFTSFPIWDDLQPTANHQAVLSKCRSDFSSNVTAQNE